MENDQDPILFSVKPIMSLRTSDTSCAFHFAQIKENPESGDGVEGMCSEQGKTVVAEYPCSPTAIVSGTSKADLRKTGLYKRRHFTRLLTC